jgi:hypothetical protein
MPIDVTRKGKTDRSRINPTQEHEVRYWMKKWGVSRSQLEVAVRQVGPDARAVARLLGKLTVTPAPAR